MLIKHVCEARAEHPPSNALATRCLIPQKRLANCVLGHRNPNAGWPPLNPAPSVILIFLCVAV